MDIRTLAWKNLLRRKTRAVYTGLGIFLGIGTFVAIASLTTQMEGAVQDKLDRFGANILVTPRADQMALGFGDVALGGTQVARGKLTMKDAAAIAAVGTRDKIAKIVPVFLTSHEASGKEIVWMGVSAADIGKARPWWKVAGRPIAAPGEVILGSGAAALLDKGPGGSLASRGKMFRVAGVLAPTGEKEDEMVIADIREVQRIAGAPEAVSFIEVAAHCKDCPVDEIVDEIGKALPGARVSAIRQVVESRREVVSHFRRLGFGVSAIVLAIAGLMVFVTVSGSVQERTREIGVLRAVGFRRRSIRLLLLWESGWVSFGASAAGAVAGLAASFAAAPFFGIELATVRPLPALVGVSIGLALGLAGTVMPARRASALSPTEAIRTL
jgi:putative ABC transport system permease protein